MAIVNQFKPPAVHSSAADLKTAAEHRLHSIAVPVVKLSHRLNANDHIGVAVVAALLWTFPLLAQPVITVQPRPQGVELGATTIFSVAATGEEKLNYQWLKDGFPLIDGANMLGTQTSTLQLSQVAAHDAAIYSVTVADLTGKTTSSKVGLMVQLSRWQVPGGIQRLINDVSISGDVAYLADGGSAGIHAVNVSDRQRPSHMHGHSANGYPLSVAASGNHIYLAQGNSGLRIFDVTDHSQILWRGDISVDGYAQAVAASDSYAYVARRESGLYVINTEDPERPVRVGICDTATTAMDVVLHENMAFVAAGESGLVIINVTTPWNPVIVGSINTSSNATAVAVSDHRAYVSVQGYGVEIVDIRDATQPRRVGSFRTSGESAGIATIGNYVYVADGHFGLSITDAVDPAKPQDLGGMNIGGFAGNVALAGNYAYIAGFNLGLIILAVPTPPSPRLGMSLNAGRIRLHLRATSAGPYLIEASPSLAADQTWTLVTNVAGTEAVVELAPGIDPQQFYRARQAR